MKAHKFGITATGYYQVKVGGWNCPCCRVDFKDKQKARRSVRRKLKQEDYEIKNYYDK